MQLTGLMQWYSVMAGKINLEMSGLISQLCFWIKDWWRSQMESLLNVMSTWNMNKRLDFQAKEFGQENRSALPNSPRAIVYLLGTEIGFCSDTEYISQRPR